MPDKITFIGSGALNRIIIPSSFVVTIDDRVLIQEAVNLPLAGFRLGKGGWIIQAKATIRTQAPEKIDVQFVLTAKEDSTTVDDRALASASNLGYATIVTVLGVHFTTSGQVDLTWTKQGLPLADLTGIVVTAIHHDDLTIGVM